MIYLNKVFDFKNEKNYLWQVNPVIMPDPSKILFEFNFEHTIPRSNMKATQEKLKILNGKSNTFYCGSYHGNLQHEAAISSANTVAKLLG
jgi:predicted NAD/FAD-binding protein